MFCSRKEPFGFELLSLSQALEKIELFISAENVHFYFFHPSSIGDIFGFMLTGGALQSCFIVGAVRRIIFILLYYESVLCDTSYVLCSIMHSSHLLPVSHNPNFPSPVAYHSLPEWLLASFEASFCSPQKCLKSPTHLHIFLSINEITWGIHITGLSQKGFLWPQLFFTSSLYIDHPPSVVIFHNIH